MTAIMLKREDDKFSSFSDEEKEDIYDSLRDKK
jgi:hypothetical protein